MTDDHEGEVPSTSPSGVSGSSGVSGPSGASGASGVRAHAKTVLIGSTRFLGPGVVELLDAVAESGSVKSACAKMGLSYTKGWRLIHTLEQQVGATCVTRQQGGVGGGKASLTPECRVLLDRFAAFTSAVDARVDELFARHFPEYGTPPRA